MRGPLKDGPGTVNTTISIGGMVVHPGDIILADSDGVIAIRPDDVPLAAQGAKDKAATEQAMIQSILEGRYDDAWVDVALKQKGVKL
jgi:regulator of RNase E activity RraA